MSHRDNFSDASSDDDDSWEQRAWRTRIQKISYRYDYDRKKLPYRNFVPQVPFYIHLGQPRRGPKSKGARAPQLRVRMPDTVVFGLGPDPGCNGVMKTWLFNSAEGIICRRDDFSDTDVMTRFKNEEPRAIVAVMKRPLGAAQGTQLVLLNSEDLAETLYNRDNYGLFCIQAYVPPRKGRCFLARSVWRRDGGGNGFIHECFFMTAKRSFLESGSLDDLHLNLEACDSAVVTAVNGAVAEGLEGMSTAVKSYMEKALTPSIDVEELVIDYTKDSNGRWWMLQVKSFRVSRSNRDRANTVLKGVDVLKAKGMGTEVEVAFRVPESSAMQWATGKVIAIRMEKITVQFPMSSRTEDVNTADFGRLWRLPVRKPRGTAATQAEISTSREEVHPVSKAPTQASLRASHTRLHLQGLNRPPPDIDWDGHHLTRAKSAYSGGLPPTSSGQRLGTMDNDASFKCKWCGTKCRSTYLRCTMTRKMIADVQSHMQRRGVEFSWFERTDIELSSMSGQASLSSSTSSKFTPVRVCQICYEIYVTEMKLMKAERLYGKEIGIPTSIHDVAGLTDDIVTALDGVKNISVEQQPPDVLVDVPDNLQCFRFMIYFGEIEALPVSLLFGTPGLSLQYKFLGITTRMPLNVAGATLHRQVRLPRASSRDVKPELEPRPDSLDGAPEPASAPESEPEPETALQSISARALVAETMVAEAKVAMETAEAEAKKAGAEEKEGAEKRLEAAQTDFNLKLQVAHEVATEASAEAAQKVADAEAAMSSAEASSSPEALDAATAALMAAKAELEERSLHRKSTESKYKTVKVGKGDTEVRVRRSLFAQDAERKRKEREAAEEARKTREAAHTLAEQRRLEEKARKKAEARQQAEAAILRAEEAKKQRELALAAAEERKRLEAEEEEELRKESERLASEPTFSVATVPISKLRPFYLFGCSQYRDLKPFLAKQEKINLSLCAAGGRVLSTAQIPLIQLASQMWDRKETLVHFHSEGMRDCFVKVTMGVTRVNEGVAPQHLPLQRYHEGLYLCKDLGFSPPVPLPHGWLASLKQQDTSAPAVAQREDDHAIAQHELRTKQAAKLALREIHLATTKNAEVSSVLLKDETAHPDGSEAALSGFGTKIDRGGHFTRTSSLSQKSRLEAREIASQHEKENAVAQRDKACAWRCVIEVLHVAGLGQRSRGGMYARGGVEVAVEFRLFGQSVTTELAPASPPVTLLDSSHTIFVKARQSNLRRYFFASPRVTVVLLASSVHRTDEADEGEKEPVVMGRGTLDIQPLLKNGFFETDVDVAVPNEKESAKVHVALWLERLGKEEVPRARGGPFRAVVGKDIGFGVRTVRYEQESPVPGLDLLRGGETAAELNPDGC